MRRMKYVLQSNHLDGGETVKQKRERELTGALGNRYFQASIAAGNLRKHLYEGHR